LESRFVEFNTRITNKIYVKYIKDAVSSRVDTLAVAEMNGYTPTRPGKMRDGEKGTRPSYLVIVSLKFIVLSLLSSMLLAFAIGRAARLVLLERPKNALDQAYWKSVRLESEDSNSLPSLLAKDGKKIPHTRYVSKIFDTARTASSSSWLTSREIVPSAEDKMFSSNEDEEDEDYEDTEQQTPVAAHLMVDIKYVDGEFLNSKSRLANAMLEVVNEAGLTLLSYHCHDIIPIGVSCVGVLFHNYMSFHTWPESGVITLDLCAGGTTTLLPVLPMIERRFGVPQSGRMIEKPEMRWAHNFGVPQSGQTLEKPEMIWAHKVRGFSPEDEEESSLMHLTDLGLYVLNNLEEEVKERVSLI
jgi:S-adenosylmethionine/arginine decarboxylase-like enzyme